MYVCAYTCTDVVGVQRCNEEFSNTIYHTQDATLYAASQEITYLDNVLQESLRLYPPVAMYANTHSPDV